ncbi:UDP-N-acetylmuramoyl-tripeptide--D-alanyl-D-alanine ligase [Paenibacillus filicis]|uniref:UDP-N-acetylmuramoyl-tripeptide--D-alanyl-D-alanine ligase n=1 Tax=Paenibacillus gyeongsangnamensis TaxID=3388067 RepID=A0ABT4QFX2_9BACL|nr:UDP-N-acetylmuramoyl-tripeptide--D-alanyl-D-alanine ligase [Paenibacillus filicis]MCZ8515778.1 UDP-N-acetylmuramoyl-tripeptide--D-alanyl-D-alanine ligase [Paenibacillus filicis]
MPKFSRPVIAVTGSAGKTTTKEMIASILRTRWNIFKSHSNQNLPPSTRRHIKQIRKQDRAAVLEFGMLKPGHIKAHCKVIQPSIGVITNVGTAHIGNVGNRVEGIARAKSELIRYMNPKGTLVVNADDRNSGLLATQDFQGKRIRIGIRNKADYKAHSIHSTRRGVSFRVRLDGKDTEFFIPCLGDHNVYNALNAIAVTHRLRFTAKEIKTGLARYPIPYRRLVRTELPNRVTLIDDTFSSNPNAAKAALDVLASIGRQRTIAVIGYMKDLGDYAVKGHKDVGRHASRKRVTRLFTVGSLARHIAQGAKEAGLPANRIRCFTSKPELHKALAAAIKPDTAILVKGTHLLKLEQTVAFLKKSKT